MSLHLSEPPVRSVVEGLQDHSYYSGFFKRSKWEDSRVVRPKDMHLINFPHPPVILSRCPWDHPLRNDTDIIHLTEEDSKVLP